LSGSIRKLGGFPAVSDSRAVVAGPRTAARASAAPRQASLSATAGEVSTLPLSADTSTVSSAGDRSYRALFGNRAYVTDGAEPKLLERAGQVLARTPELAESQLARSVAAGKLEPGDVAELQRFLQDRGFSVGAPGADGKYGPLTHSALQGFLAAVPAPAPASASAPASVSVAAGEVSARPRSGRDDRRGSPAGTAPVATATATAAETASESAAASATAYASASASACASASAPPSGAFRPRSMTETGSAFIARIRDLPLDKREAAIVAAITSDNVPDFLRKAAEVRVTARGKDGKLHEAVIPVLPDYLAVGTECDFVRVPLSPLAAQRIADTLGFSLPTRKLVDDIYGQADVKLTPKPLPPIGMKMMTVDYFDRHNATIAGQLGGTPPAGLVAGHKKDVILSNAVAQHPDRVIIYGWHQPGGKAIQPLSWIHENTYSDYSHGVRLVGKTITVDGQPRPLAEVLADPDLAPLVSDEGPIRTARYKL